MHILYNGLNDNLDDVVDYGNFKIKLSGNISLSPNVTKMILIYSNSERQLLEFTLTPSAFGIILSIKLNNYFIYLTNNMYITNNIYI